MERGAIRTVGIVGGGPGGAQCARSLRERGFDVTLFEPRSAFEKACGGGIPARGLEDFPFLRNARLPAKIVTRCLVIAPSGREADFPLLDPLAVVSRAELHTFLLERAAGAGAHLVRARVTSFDRDGASGWRVTARATSGDARAEGHGPFDFLVAADGASGIARRRLSAALPPADLTQGLGYYVPGLSEDRITLKFYEGLDGYLWIFPRADHSSVGICAGLGARPAADLRHLMDRFLCERYGEQILSRSARYGALIPDAPRNPESEALQGEGWALVGDSGRSVDPLTREGIYYAMLAGETLAACLADGDPARYARDWRSTCGREFSWAARHASRFFERRFIERLVAVCDLSPIVATFEEDVKPGTRVR